MRKSTADDHFLFDMTSSKPGADDGEQSLAAICVRALLDRHEVPRHKHSTLTADVLGLSYSHAHRKVQKDSTWSLEELKRMAEFFGETLAQLVSLGEAEAPRSAVLLAGSARVPCRIWLEQEAKSALPGSLVAIAVGSEWVVMPAGDNAPPHAFDIRLLVLQGDAQTARRIAVLDDKRDTTDSLVEALVASGFEATPFYAAQDLADAVRARPFDGYLIDWIIGNQDSRELIAGIRESDLQCPIGLLTGEFDTGRAQANEVADAVRRYKLMFFEKPLRLPIISAQLTQAFGPR